MFIYFLSGIVSEILPNTVVLDCSGVAFECAATSYTISRLKIGEPAKLYTYCSIREDAFDLFGFESKDERSCFEKLISVNGVGPKAAIAILSAANPSAFRLAIASGDEKALTAAPGIGKKLAQRILLELRDKITPDSSDFGDALVIKGGDSAMEREAAEALSQLGYSQSEISAALKKAPKDLTNVSDLVRFALRSMMMKG